MAGDPRVRRLLQEVLESRRTPEEVCRDCPELLPEVRLRWQRLVSIEARIGALLPEPPSTSGAVAPPSGHRIDDPPHIFGYHVDAVLGHGLTAYDAGRPARPSDRPPGREPAGQADRLQRRRRKAYSFMG